MWVGGEKYDSQVERTLASFLREAEGEVCRYGTCSYSNPITEIQSQKRILNPVIAQQSALRLSTATVLNASTFLVFLLFSPSPHLGRHGGA